LGERLSADPALMQLLPLMALRNEANVTGLAAHAAGRAEGAAAFLVHALVLQEIARRTGEIETLGRAASAVLRARDLAKGDRRLTARALLSHAQILYLAHTLFGDAEAATVAAQRLDEAMALSLDPVSRARADALAASLIAQVALASEAAETHLCATAALALAGAAKALAALARAGKLDDSEAHEIACNRVELLIAMGRRGKDRRVLADACAELDLMTPSLNAAYRPLTWARRDILRAQALAAMGDLSGEPALIADASAVLAAVVEEIPEGHSPLDAARAGHALGLVLQSLGEACEEQALFDRAIDAFAPAVQALAAASNLPLRAVVAHDSAVCLARSAERSGDLEALSRAEAVFRAALTCKSAAADPLAWAVTQVALARVYEARADICGDARERAGAAFALTSALDVFSERGHRSLSAVALSALDRVKGRAPI
jgi:hypothetical protein